MAILPNNEPTDNNPGADLWSLVLESLRGQMTGSTFNSVFGGSQAELSGDTLIIYPHSEVARQWLEKRWLKRITETVEATAGRQMTIEIKPAPDTRPAYLPLEDFFEPEPDHPDAEFQGVYHDQRNAIIQPHRVEQHSQYFRKKWRPLLGPLLSELIRELRQRCHYKTRRNTFKTTYKSLAAALGVSEPTIKRALARDKDGQFKNAHLGYFIRDMKVLKVSSGDRSIRNLGTRFTIYLDEPLTPDDQAKISTGSI